jgi:ubiquinone/menaquinone biosynthesis C-methylase UbiE
MAHDHPRRFSPAQAHRLDAPERRLWLPIEPVLKAIELTPGMAVADIGAGTGYFALPIAQAVGSSGRVSAVDVASEMLALLNEKILTAGITNIDCVRGEAEATGLESAAFDRVLLANIWHEVDDRSATLKEAARLLRPEGRIVILDWSPDVPASGATQPGPPIEHRIPLSEVRRQLAGSDWGISFAGAIGEYSWLVLATRPFALRSAG